jgi:hypothetical protein
VIWSFDSPGWILTEKPVKILREKPAWVPTMKQPPKNQNELRLNKIIGPNSVEQFSSKIIYVDGIPYMKVDPLKRGTNNQQ